VINGTNPPFGEYGISPPSTFSTKMAAPRRNIQEEIDIFLTVDELKVELKITDEQATAVKEIVHKRTEEVKARAPEVHAELLELHKILTEKHFGWRLKAKGKSDKLKKYREEKFKARQLAIDDIRLILSEEQRARIFLFVVAKIKQQQESEDVGPAGRLGQVLREHEAELEITEKQKGKIVSLRGKLREKGDSLKGHVVPIVTQLEKGLASGDKAMIEEGLKQSRELMKEAHAFRESITEDLRAILDPDQLVQIMVIIDSQEDQ